MTEPTSTHQFCAMCPQPGTNSCISCKSIHYCSQFCQKIDWTIHKVLCKDFKKFSEPPTSDHVRAIYFAQDEGRPRFVWAPVKNNNGPPTNNSELGLNLSQIVPTESLAFLAQTKLIESNPVLRRPVPRVVCIGTIEHPSRSRIEDANNSISAIDAELTSTTCRPIVFYGQGHRSLDMTDFRNIVDQLRWYYYLTVDINPNRFLTEKNVECVRISCAGDEVLGHQPEYLPFLYPERVTYWDQRRLDIPVFEHIGLPLAAIQLDDALIWRGRKFQSLPTNQSLPTCQFLPANTNRLWAKINPGEMYKSHPGSFIMMRTDGKPLKVVHAIAVVDYCVSILGRIQLDRRFMEDKSISQKERSGLAVLTSKAKLANLLKHASPEGFRYFWEKAIMARDGTKVKDTAISPFEV